MFRVILVNSWLYLKTFQVIFSQVIFSYISAFKFQLFIFSAYPLILSSYSISIYIYFTSYQESMGVPFWPAHLSRMGVDAPCGRECDCTCPPTIFFPDVTQFGPIQSNLAKIGPDMGPILSETVQNWTRYGRNTY